jgi:hypothetical protein
MKNKIILTTILTLSFLIFITLCLVSCYTAPSLPPTSNEDTTIETTTAENDATETETPEIETVFNISIANGSGSSGLAKKTAELFETIKYPSGIDKYNITHITNADNYNYENTKIICKSDNTLLIQAAEDIKTVLEVGIITTSNELSEDTDIAIIIGKDYSLPAGVKIKEHDKKNESEINYEIVRTLNTRLDDTVTYYVLIDPIDLSDDYFKEDIKEVISKIVEEKDRKIDIVIFDNRNSLENGYKDDEFLITGDLEEWENWYTDEVIRDLAMHCIATFSGENEYDFYFNTLYFFIYSDSVDSGEVETSKYAEVIEFNPYTEEQVGNSEDLRVDENNQEKIAGLLDKIEISAEAQDIFDGELKIVVWVKNNSEKTFSGYIMIEFYDKKNKVIWQDWSSYTWDFQTVVPPGQSHYCIMWIPLEKGYPVGIKSRIKDYQFY